MSDARRMNQAITGYLKQVLGDSVRDSHIHALALMITGLIRGKSSHFEKISANSGAKAKYPSRVKQIHRFVKNKHVSYEAHYLPFSEAVIASLGLTEYRLSIDSSQAGRNCLLLTIGLVYKKRVIPLVWRSTQAAKAIVVPRNNLNCWNGSSVCCRMGQRSSSLAMLNSTGHQSLIGWRLNKTGSMLVAPPKTRKFGLVRKSNGKLYRILLHHPVKANRSMASFSPGKMLGRSILPLSGMNKSRSISIW